MGDEAAIVLAAGQGTRMKSKLTKVLHPLAGIPMIRHVVRSLAQAGLDRVYLVIGHQAEQVREAVPDVPWILQEKQLGTGHAVDQCREALADFDGAVLVTYGDTPLFQGKTFRACLGHHRDVGATATVITARMPDPSGYGRIVRSVSGDVQQIVEHKDATEQQRQINEINTGTYCFDGKLLFEYLRRIHNANAQGEYYLPDVLPLMIADGHRVSGYVMVDPSESMGINHRGQLAEAERVIGDRIRNHWMLQGVTLIDPAATYFEVDCVIGEDTTIYPGCYIGQGTKIGAGCHIGPNVRLERAVLGEGVRVEEAVVVASKVGDGCQIGPYAYLRPGTTLKAGCKVGDFVEVKNSTVGAGSKIPHHSYIGDTDMGSGVNIGCGTITCNFDGREKHRTVIENNVFVGSNTSLVAPLRVGEGSYIGAGSTITKDVPPGSLGISRSHQRNKEGWTNRVNRDG